MQHTLPGVTMHCADYRDILPTLPEASFDAIIADPPYATTNFAWDQPVDWPGFWAQADRICTERALVVLFSAQPFTTELINSNRRQFRYEIIWQIKPLPEAGPSSGRGAGQPARRFYRDRDR